MISTPTLNLREIAHRRKTSSLLVGLVAVMIGAVTFFSVNRTGYEKEMTRNARDIGSNVVILPSAVDQVAYHLQGGYSEETMHEAVLEQLLEHRASLNHLIPMLEEPTEIGFNQKRSAARLVGLSASVPMPGRPKSPMQRSIAKEQVQLGSQVAEALGIQRDEPAQVTIAGRDLTVIRERGLRRNAQLPHVVGAQHPELDPLHPFELCDRRRALNSTARARRESHA